METPFSTDLPRRPQSIRRRIAAQTQVRSVAEEPGRSRLKALRAEIDQQEVKIDQVFQPVRDRQQVEEEATRRGERLPFGMRVKRFLDKHVPMIFTRPRQLHTLTEAQKKRDVLDKQRSNLEKEVFK